MVYLGLLVAELAPVGFFKQKELLKREGKKDSERKEAGLQSTPSPRSHNWEDIRFPMQRDLVET
jgi:hypothetical protein